MQRSDSYHNFSISEQCQWVESEWAEWRVVCPCVANRRSSRGRWVAAGPLGAAPRSLGRRGVLFGQLCDFGGVETASREYETDAGVHRKNVMY